MGKLTPAKLRDKHHKTFEKFWETYPRHTHRIEATNVWSSLMEDGGDPVQIVGAARAFANKLDNIKFAPAPHRWLQNGRYDDADLFADEAAAGKAWLQAQWQSANVKAVEDRYHITMEKRYPPEGMTDTKAIAFWYREIAREFIHQVYREKVECQPTTNGQNSPSSEPSSAPQESSLV